MKDEKSVLADKEGLQLLENEDKSMVLEKAE